MRALYAAFATIWCKVSHSMQNNHWKGKSKPHDYAVESYNNWVCVHCSINVYNYLITENIYHVGTSNVYYKIKQTCCYLLNIYNSLSPYVVLLTTSVYFCLPVADVTCCLSLLEKGCLICCTLRGPSHLFCFFESFPIWMFWCDLCRSQYNLLDLEGHIKMWNSSLK